MNLLTQIRDKYESPRFSRLSKCGRNFQLNKWLENALLYVVLL